jgi:hypothetical protein
LMGKMLGQKPVGQQGSQFTLLPSRWKAELVTQQTALMLLENGDAMMRGGGARGMSMVREMGREIAGVRGFAIQPAVLQSEPACEGVI